MPNNKYINSGLDIYSEPLFFLPLFSVNLQIPIKTCHIRQNCVRPCRNLRFSTPFLHPAYTCPTFAYFIISPTGRSPGGKRAGKAVYPRKGNTVGIEWTGSGLVPQKIKYHIFFIHTHRGSQRGCGLFMFDTFPALSFLLYRKAHNPTKERTPQKGPALFCCQGKEPWLAACPLFSEIRK